MCSARILSKITIIIALLSSACLLGAYPVVSSALTEEELEVQIANLVAQVEALQSVLEGLKSTAVQTGAVSDLVCISLTRPLAIGASGDDVHDLQDFLIKAGTLAGGNATGYFGPLTEAAVRAWQSARGVVSSGDAATTGFGAVGPRTRAAIQAGCGSGTQISSLSETPTVPTGPSIMFTSPREGTVVAGGSSLTIEWQSTNAPSGARVSLELIDSAGAYVDVLTQSTDPSGTYAWRVPQRSAQECSGGTAFDCIVEIAECEDANSCTLPLGTYAIVARLSNVAVATSPSFRVTGSEYSNLFDALFNVVRDASSQNSFTNTTSGGSNTSLIPGSCVHEGASYDPGVSISVTCSAGNCPSYAGGTGYTTAQCTSGQWCIPLTAHCASSISAIDVSTYEGASSGEVSSGYAISCPQEGYRAYLSCPHGGCATGWNTCRGGSWVRDTEQQVVPPGTQGPCLTGQLWCAISNDQYGCVPKAQCVGGVATSTTQ